MSLPAKKQEEKPLEKFVPSLAWMTKVEQQFRQRVVEHGGALLCFDEEDYKALYSISANPGDEKVLSLIENLACDMGVAKDGSVYVHLAYRRQDPMVYIYYENKFYKELRVPGQARQVRWHPSREGKLLVSHEMFNKIKFTLMNLEDSIESKTIEFDAAKFSWAHGGDFIIPSKQKFIIVRDAIWDDVTHKEKYITEFNIFSSEEETIHHVGIHNGFLYISSNLGIYAASVDPSMPSVTSEDIKRTMKKISQMNACAIIGQYVVSDGGVYEVSGFNMWSVCDVEICALIPGEQVKMITMDGSVYKAPEFNNEIYKGLTDEVDALAAKMRELQRKKRNLEMREIRLMERQEKMVKVLTELQEFAKLLSAKYKNEIGEINDVIKDITRKGTSPLNKLIDYMNKKYPEN